MFSDWLDIVIFHSDVLGDFHISDFLLFLCCCWMLCCIVLIIREIYRRG